MLHHNHYSENIDDTFVYSRCSVATSKMFRCSVVTSKDDQRCSLATSKDVRMFSGYIKRCSDVQWHLPMLSYFLPHFPYIMKYNGYCRAPIFCTARNKKPGSGHEMRLQLCIMHIQLFACTILVFVFCYFHL